jgi:hypothetical protein
VLPEYLHRFVQTRSDTLTELRSLSQLQLDQRPSPEKWSIGEILDHVYLAERFFRKQIERLVARVRAGQSTYLRLTFADLNVRPALVPAVLLPLLEIPFSITNVLVPKPIRQQLIASPLGRARHPDAANPRASLSKEQLEQLLESGLAETIALFDQNSDVDFSALRISHPLLGDNSVVELVGIIIAHEIGHLKKIQNSLQRARRMQPAAPPAGTTYPVIPDHQ